MSHIHHLLRKNETALIKTASYYVIHVVVAACVAYAVTGHLLAAMTLSLPAADDKRGMSVLNSRKGK